MEREIVKLPWHINAKNRNAASNGKICRFLVENIFTAPNRGQHMYHRKHPIHGKSQELQVCVE